MENAPGLNRTRANGLRSSTEYLEKGAAVGGGQYSSAADGTAPADQVDAPPPLTVARPASPPLPYSPDVLSPAHPGLATGAELRAMAAMALDESRDDDQGYENEGFEAESPPRSPGWVQHAYSPQTSPKRPLRSGAGTEEISAATDAPQKPGLATPSSPSSSVRSIYAPRQPQQQQQHFDAGLASSQAEPADTGKVASGTSSRQDGGGLAGGPGRPTSSMYGNAQLPDELRPQYVTPTKPSAPTTKTVTSTSTTISGDRAVEESGEGPEAVPSTAAQQQQRRRGEVQGTREARGDVRAPQDAPSAPGSSTPQKDHQRSQPHDPEPHYASPSGPSRPRTSETAQRPSSLPYGNAHASPGQPRSRPHTPNTHPAAQIYGAKTPTHSTGHGGGRGSPAAAAGSRPAQRGLAPGSRAAAAVAAAGRGRGRSRREELFEEEDPAVVLEQSVALLSEIEGLIREEVSLAPDTPLDDIPPAAAARIPHELLDALEDTLEVISMARNELAVRAGRPSQPVATLRRPSSAASNTTSSSARAGRPSGTGSPYGVYGGYGGQQYHHHQEPLLQRVGSGSGSAGGHRALGQQGSQQSLGRSPSYSHSQRASSTSGYVPGQHGRWYGHGHVSAAGGGAHGSPSSGGAAWGARRSGSASRRPGTGEGSPQPSSARLRTSNSGSVQSSVDGGQSVASASSTRSRAWHRESPPEEWLQAKQHQADAEKRKREQQVAADMRFLQQIRSRSTAVQQEHEALLAAAEESVRAARTAKAAAEAQHRWLEYQNRVAERAKQQHEEVEMQLQYGGGVVGLL